MNDVKCKRCGRWLKNPKFIELGYGRTCYEKILIRDRQKSLLEDKKK